MRKRLSKPRNVSLYAVNVDNVRTAITYRESVTTIELEPEAAGQRGATAAGAESYARNFQVFACATSTRRQRKWPHSADVGTEVLRGRRAQAHVWQQIPVPSGCAGVRRAAPWA